MSKKTRNPEFFPGSEYKGYIAHSCIPSVWVDRYNGDKQTKACFKLYLETPYPPGISDEELDSKLKNDLEEVFPDIGLIGHNECNRRAFENDVYYKPFGCQKRVNWSHGTCSVVLLLFDEFEGFPVEDEEDQPSDDIPDEMLQIYEDMNITED